MPGILPDLRLCDESCSRGLVLRYRMLLLIALVLGVSAGLRSMTPPAVVAWAAGSWPGVAASPLSFMASRLVSYLFIAFAAGELIADKLPFIPSRLMAGPLIARICSGALCGAVVAAAAGAGLVAPAIAGAVGGVAGAFGGYHVRRNLTTSGGLPDLVVALIEDVVAIGLAVFAVSRV